MDLKALLAFVFQTELQRLQEKDDRLETQQQQSAVPLALTLRLSEPVSNDACTDVDDLLQATRSFRFGYSSCEWEWRRRALQLARLQHCVTRSGQTLLSHFRTDAESQTQGARSVGQSPDCSKGTHAAKASRAITGLRGLSAAQGKDAKTIRMKMHL